MRVKAEPPRPLVQAIRGAGRRRSQAGTGTARGPDHESEPELKRHLLQQVTVFTAVACFSGSTASELGSVILAGSRVVEAFWLTYAVIVWEGMAYFRRPSTGNLIRFSASNRV